MVIKLINSLKRKTAGHQAHVNTRDEKVCLEVYKGFVFHSGSFGYVISIRCLPLGSLFLWGQVNKHKQNPYVWGGAHFHLKSECPHHPLLRNMIKYRMKAPPIPKIHILTYRTVSFIPQSIQCDCISFQNSNLTVFFSPSFAKHAS